MKAVCNTSPVILLAKIGRLVLLRDLYEDIRVPEAVLAEVQQKRRAEVREIQRLIEAGELRVERVDREDLVGLPEELGPGEREAIALTLKIGARLVILDDQAGRALARSRKLQVTGTIGVLLEAKLRGLLPALRPELDHLVESGLWISEAFYDEVLRAAGE